MKKEDRFLQLRHLSESFLTAYINLSIMNTQTEDLTFLIPMIVNGAFSAELSLKALLMKANVDYSREHNLLYLFLLLPSEIQVQIVNDSMSRTSAFRDMELWMDQLILISDAFEQWRYAYESSQSLILDTNFLQAFAQACGQVLSNHCGDVFVKQSVVKNEQEIDLKIAEAIQKSKETALKHLASIEKKRGNK